jgi:hypothetical protein
MIATDVSEESETLNQKELESVVEQETVEKLSIQDTTE